MPSKHWIDWRKHDARIADLKLGVAADGIGTPLLLGLRKNTNFVFIPKAIQDQALAWVVRDGSKYFVMTNCEVQVERPHYVGLDDKGNHVVEQRKYKEGLVHGPFKSLASAIQYVRLLGQ